MATDDGQGRGHLGQWRRLRSRAARSAVGALGVDLDRVVHLDSHEQRPAAWVERVGVHATATTVTAVHPRDQESLTHGFAKRWIYRIPACIWDPQANLLYTHEGRMIAESTSWPPLHALTSWPIRPGHAGTVTVVGPCVIMPTSGYYHWLLEDLPCLLGALDQAPEATIVVARDCPPYVRSFLNTLANPIVTITGPVTLDDVVLVGRGPDTGWVHPVDATRLVALAPAPSSDPRRLLYVSRLGSRRSPSNESAIESLCRGLGFEVVRPDALSVLDQVRLFAQADVVIGPHGAGLANCVWAPSGTRLLELFQADYVVPCYSTLSAVRALEYSGIVSSADDGTAIDLAAIESFITALGSAQA